MRDMDERQEREYSKMLSPISETDSNKYATLDSYGQTIKRVNPNEERKLTGTGTYDLDNIPQTL